MHCLVLIHGTILELPEFSVVRWTVTACSMPARLSAAELPSSQILWGISMFGSVVLVASRYMGLGRLEPCTGTHEAR